MNVWQLRTIENPATTINTAQHTSASPVPSAATWTNSHSTSEQSSATAKAQLDRGSRPVTSEIAHARWDRLTASTATPDARPERGQ
jgi:hypothetical protein